MVTDRLPAVAVARLVAASALEVPDVVGFHGGAVGEIATYGGGTRVRGVRIYGPPNPRIRLRLIVRFGARLDDLAEDVRQRIRAALDTVAPEFARGPIDVHVADVGTDAEALPVGTSEETVRWS